MLRTHAGVDPFAPEPKAASFQFFAHEAYNVCFAQAELIRDRLKGRAVFPRHFNDPITIFLTQLEIRHWYNLLGLCEVVANSKTLVVSFSVPHFINAESLGKGSVGVS